jgi:hypothetical protein
MTEQAEKIVQDLFGLRTHPFNPVLDAAGNPIQPELFARPLDPQVEPRLASYYQDLYDWSKSQSIGGIRNGDFTRFPDSGLLSSRGALLVLINGFEETGRASLLNLILFILARNYGGILKLSAPLTDTDDVTNVLSIAQGFLVRYPKLGKKPTQKELQSTYQVLTNPPVIGETSAYHNLFAAWGELIRETRKEPLVLVLTGKVRASTWSVIYNSTRELFSFIFVLTDQKEYAGGCYRSLRRDNRNVALVAADFLNASSARDYILSRLKQERLRPGQLSLAPFTDGALEEMYRKGATARPNDEVAFPVGFINMTLRRALDDQLRRIEAAKWSAGAAAADGATWLIGANEIRTAREALNGGG